MDEPKLRLVKEWNIRPAKKNCKHCYGSGIRGYYDAEHTRPMRCRCTITEILTEKIVAVEEPKPEAKPVVKIVEDAASCPTK